VSAVVVTLVEFLGGAALIIGLLTRWAAALNGFDMLVAILVVHLKNGFLKPGGFEHPLVMLAACIALVMLGPGSISVDGALAKRE
jgi:putative oxidoreductase